MRGLINTIREMNLVKEDGHVDVSSSIRKCKTAMEDASQIMSKLQTMDPEGSLPTWWTNKLAIASMSFNKMRDYLLVSGEQKEEVDLSEREKEIDKLPRQFLNPDKEEMIIKKNKVIVINKKDLDKYLKKGWALAEKLDDKDEPTVKDVVKLLKKASQAHAGQAKDLEKAVND
jgi:acyl-CoA hydrolase